MKGEHHVQLLCEVLGVSRSGYYRWLTAKPSARARRDAELSDKIIGFYAKSRGNYGAPRILRDLKAAGIDTSEKRCARLMNERGIRGRKKHRRKPRTTDSRHAEPVAPNVLALIERPTARNQVWGHRYHLPGDRGGLAVLGRHPRWVQPTYCWLGLRSDLGRAPRDRGLAGRRGAPEAASRVAAPFRPRLPVRGAELRARTRTARDCSQHEPGGKLLRQRHDGIVLAYPQDRDRVGHQDPGDPPRRRACRLRLHRNLL